MLLDHGLLAVLKTWLDANASALNDRQAAAALNAPASPAFWVFKTSVSAEAARQSFDWSEILGVVPLPDEKRWAFETLISSGRFNPSLVNDRNGIAAIFSGGTYTVTRGNFLNNSTRRATVGEKALSSPGSGPAGGDGSAQNASAVLGFFADANGAAVWAEGEITIQNVVDARKHA